jgi:hypothetical protein
MPLYQAASASASIAVKLAHAAVSRSRGNLSHIG